MNTGYVPLIICSFFAHYTVKIPSAKISYPAVNKNSIMVFACGILLATCFAGVAQAQTIQYADHIVINEVEIGNQSQNDWVELYNPTDNVVDIGGWIISSFLLGGQTFTIPSETLLNPGEFVVYEQHGDWFSSVSSIVQIKNDGTLVDYTTLISDNDLDSQTWYRTHDGIYADSAKFWEYGNSTKNTSNQNTSHDSASMLKINVDLDSYSFGDSVLITGMVPEIVTDPAMYNVPSSLMMIIAGPESEQKITLYPNNNLEFEYTANLQPTLGFEIGSYTINVSYAQWTAMTSFVIVDELMQIEDESTKFVQIFSDSSVYNPGQTVVVSGSTNVYVQYEAITYSVMDPQGILYKSGTLFPKEDGTFVAEFQILQHNSMTGDYSVTFEYASYTADLTFKVEEVVGSDNPIDIVFDKNAYGLGDTVKITGVINDVAVTSMDILIQQVTYAPESITMHLDKKTNSIQTINSKDFSYEYIVYDNLDRLGKYKVTLTSSAHHEERIFVVVLDPETYVPDTLPFTIMSDKQTYNVGDDITFTGVINEAKGDITQGQVVITMTDPGGNKLTTASAKAGEDLVTKTVVYTLTDVPNEAGEYAVKGQLFRSLFTNGTYEATASYANDLYVESITFEVVDPLQSGSSFVLHVGKNIFDAGEQVLITAEAPGLERGSTISIELQKPGSDVESFEILSDESSFDWSWTVPSTLDDSNKGLYSAVFTNEMGTESINFTLGVEPHLDPPTITINGNLESGGTAEITGVAAGATAGGHSVAITVYNVDDSENILYMKYITVNEQDEFALEIPLVSALWDEGFYNVKASNKDESTIVEFELISGLEQIRHTEKFSNILQTNVTIQTNATDQNEQLTYPRIIQGTLVAGPYGTGQAAGISLYSPTGTCVIGSDDSCIVHEMTIVTSDGPYVIADVDGVSYKIRYSGPDANIETFTMLPAVSGQVFDDSAWQIEIHDDGLPTKFHYKITYVG